MWACPKCQRAYPDDTGMCPQDGTPRPAPQASAAAALAPGLARRYRVIRRLGGGGLGTVFLAEQIALGNRPVALKVLLPELLDDPGFLLRFHDEAASTARLRHPNVVTVYESGIADDGSPYIAMEYLRGETLRHRALHFSRSACSLRSLLPICQRQTHNPFELTGVVSDQGEAMRNRDRRNHQIIGTDGPAGLFQLRPNAAVG